MVSPSLTVVPVEPGLSRYAALAAALRARVIAGEWPPGSAGTTVREGAGKFAMIDLVL